LKKKQKQKKQENETSARPAGAGHSPAGSSPVFCGVDVGASATKVVLVDKSGAALSRCVRKSGVDYLATAKECLKAALAEAGLPPGSYPASSVATGYGRGNVDFADSRVTEITCHGRGCFESHPSSQVIVDIGGQDSKVIRLDTSGNRIDFKMNRKCAAGTGAFLEEIATRLDLSIDELDTLARGADKSFTLGSFCTVFAKTEILAHLRKGERVENIILGAFRSVVNRIVEMDRFEGDVTLTGGVVQYNPFLRETLEEALRRDVCVPPHPQFTGAFGAALIAKEDEADGKNGKAQDKRR